MLCDIVGEEGIGLVGRVCEYARLRGASGPDSMPQGGVWEIL